MTATALQGPLRRKSRVGRRVRIAAGVFACIVFLFPVFWMVLTSFKDQRDIFTTPQGWGLIVSGVIVGAIFGWIVLAVSVVSLPMLVDCNVSASQAVSASWRAAHANKPLMVRWGLTVVGLLVLGSIPLFIGLAFVLPWLGYATWHLYTRLVDRGAIASRCD